MSVCIEVEPSEQCGRVLLRKGGRHCDLRGVSGCGGVPAEAPTVDDRLSMSARYDRSMHGRGEDGRTQPGRLLITGGSGYLGRVLAARARADWDVTVTRLTQPGSGPALDVCDAAAVFLTGPKRVDV